MRINGWGLFTFRERSLPFRAISLRGECLLRTPLEINLAITAGSFDWCQNPSVTNDEGRRALMNGWRRNWNNCAHFFFRGKIIKTNRRILTSPLQGSGVVLRVPSWIKSFGDRLIYRPLLRLPSEIKLVFHIDESLLTVRFRQFHSRSRSDKAFHPQRE